MVWRRLGDKPLSEPMMARLPTHICVTRPQWVKYSGRLFHIPNLCSLIPKWIYSKSRGAYHWLNKFALHPSLNLLLLQCEHISWEGKLGLIFLRNQIFQWSSFGTNTELDVWQIFVWKLIIIKHYSLCSLLNFVHFTHARAGTNMPDYGTM